MKTRCSRSTDPGYKNYGGRGITVCDRWLESFENFLADMGEPPTPKHSLERVDNDSGYSKENCKWATRAEQLRNKRTNRWISYRGRTMCLEDWAREVGITNHGLAGRIDKSGWSIERALTTPPKRRTVTT